MFFGKHTIYLRDSKTTFEMIDADGSGRVDKSEFALGLELCGLEVEEEDLDLLWNHLDDDGGGDLDVTEMCSKLEQLYKNIAAHEKKQSSVMPRLVANKIQPLIYGKTFRIRVDVMKDFQDTAEKQEDRWLIQFGKDVLEDLHGVCPIIALAAREFQEKQEKLIESSTKIPPVPLNFHPEVPEYCGHETILLHTGFSDDEPMWKDPEVMDAKSEFLDYLKGLSNWPTILIGDVGSGKTSMIAQTCKEIQKDQPFDHIIYHSVGGTTDSVDLSLILYRFIVEVIKRFEVRYHPPDLSLETLVETFPKVLLKAEIDTTLIFIIDNLDRVTKNGQPHLDLEWFPATLPSRCRFVISCNEGKLLNNIRRNRLQFGGSVELHEIMMPRIQVRLKTPKVKKGVEEGEEGEEEESESKGSSRGSSAASHVTGSNTKRVGTSQAELGTVRALSRSYLFSSTGLAITPQTTLKEMIELLIFQVEEIFGKYLVRRYCLFVLISRDGILEQDLFDLMNAAKQQKVVMGDCRISWQEYLSLKLHLLPFFSTLGYGENELIAPTSVRIMTALSHHFINESIMAEAHEFCVMHYRGQLKFLHSARSTWCGECRRALSELPHHQIHAEMWHAVLETMAGLVYVEARSSLGIHQTLSLCADYHHVCNKTDGPQHWIKTEYLRMRDSHTMVYRYANQLYKHPRWVFGIGANLPDSTGISQHAKVQWTFKKEVRPQLVWINKAKVKDPCVICLQEPKIVWHFACFSRDMRFLVTVGQDIRIFFWHPINGHIMYTFEGHTDEVMSLQFSWDDEYLVSASRDGSMILWKTPAEAPDRKAEEEEARELASQGGFSRARSGYSQRSGKSGVSGRPKTGISFKSQSLKGFPKTDDRCEIVT